MAALTWRNVDAPDFRTSLEGYQTFSKLLDNAFGGATRAIDTLDLSLDRQANQAVIAAAMRERDPEAYEAALKSGAFIQGVDPSRVSAATYGALNNQAGSLLEQVAKREALGDTRRVRGQTLALDALAPTALGALDARYSDKPDSAAEELIRQRASDIGFKNALGISEALNTAQKSGVGLAGDRLQQVVTRDNNARAWNQDARQAAEAARAATQFGWTAQDREESRAAIGTLGKILESVNPNDPESIRSAVFGLGSTLSPVVRAQVYNAASERFPGLFKADEIAAPVSTGAGVSDPTRVMNYQARAAGFNSVPDSVRTLGAASDFALQVNRAGVESSAMGTYQIVGQTMRNYGPKVFGSNWKNVEFNQANQDKLAEAIFNDHRGSADALRGQWVSLTPAEAERVRKMPWEQARQVIAAKESGASPAQLIAGARIRAAQDTSGKVPVQQILDAATKGGDVRDVAARLQAGRFKGAPIKFVMDQINDIVRRGTLPDGRRTITPAMAETILNGAATEKSGFVTGGGLINDAINAASDFLPGSSIRDYVANRARGNSVRVGQDGFRLNGDFITGEINRYRKIDPRTGRTGVENDIARGQAIESDTQTIAAAANAVANAQAALAQARQRAPSMTQSWRNNNLPRLEANLAKAQIAYRTVAPGIEERTRPIAERPAQPSGWSVQNLINNIRNTDWIDMFTPKRGN